jgi:hypothetical protein
MLAMQFILTLLFAHHLYWMLGAEPAASGGCRAVMQESGCAQEASQGCRQELWMDIR